MNIYSTGIRMTASGCSTLFGGSLGMCGSFDEGGVKFQNGERFELFRDWQEMLNDAPNLAKSWQVTGEANILPDPSPICDASPSCGEPGDVFDCVSAKRRHLQVNPGCTRTCADINIPQFRQQCEKDIEITGDVTWACEPAYINPIIATDRITPGYGRWYVSWQDEHCYQDCDSNSPSCGGNAQPWQELYDDPATCCFEQLSYKNADWCKESSLGNNYPGSGQFYVDNPNW